MHALLVSSALVVRDALTHFNPIVMVSACTNWMRSFSGYANRTTREESYGRFGSSTFAKSALWLRAGDPEREQPLCLVVSGHSCSAAYRRLRSFRPKPAIDLVETLEVPLEHQLPHRSGTERRSLAPGHKPISHSAQRIVIDELIVIDGNDGPAVASRVTGTPQPSGASAHPQRGERRQRSSSEAAL